MSSEPSVVEVLDAAIAAVARSAAQSTREFATTCQRLSRALSQLKAVTEFPLPPGVDRRASWEHAVSNQEGEVRGTL